MSSLCDSIGSAFNSAVNSLIEGLKSLFCLPEGYLDEKFNYLKGMLEDKFLATQFVSYIRTFENVQSVIPDNITCQLYGQTFTIVDWQYISTVLPTIHFWVRGLVFIYLIWFNFNKIIWLIRGTYSLSPGGASASNNTGAETRANERKKP